MSRTYRTGELSELVLHRRIKPAGDFVLVRAIFAADAFEGSGLVIKTEDGRTIGGDVRDAVCFEVVEIGPDVRPGSIQPGMHLLHNSLAGDVLEHGDTACRYAFIRPADVLCWWWPDALPESKPQE